MKTLSILLIWLGVLVLVFAGSWLLPLIGFVATIAVGCWATARIAGDSEPVK